LNASRFLEEAIALLGEAGVQAGVAIEARFLEAARYGSGAALAVVRPIDEHQVARLLVLARECALRLVPQGAHTGLVLGATPNDAQGDVVLSTDRLRDVFEFDALDNTLRVSAGFRLGELNERLEEHGVHFPIDLSADPSVGGMIATNTGGTRMMRHGDVRANTLGVTVVLAEPAGEVLRCEPALFKANAGIDAKHLFIGTGGAFGVVTEAVLRLHPLPRQRAVAMVALSSDEATWPFYSAASSAFGDLVSAFEGISGKALDLAVRHGTGLRAPFEGAPPVHAILLELSSALGPRDLDLDASLSTFLGQQLEAEGIIDAVVGRREALWAIRHRIGEGLRAHGEVMGLDLSFPRRRYAAFSAEARAWLAEWNGAVEVADFGHLGDGGVHFNLVWPRGLLDAAAVRGLRAAMYDIAAAHGGCFSAEHGIGPHVQAAYERHTAAPQLALARRLAGALAPHGELGTMRFAGSSATGRLHDDPSFSS
jgi:FAD/FMN-containing dehydrogenase